MSPVVAFAIALAVLLGSHFWLAHGGPSLWIVAGVFTIGFGVGYAAWKVDRQ